MQWSTVLIVSVVLGACLGSAAPTEATNSTDSLVSLGPLNFIKPILVSALGENTLLAIQNNLFNLLAAVQSHDISNITGAILSIVDPMNIIRGSMTILNNYENHMWDPNFRQQIGNLMKGGSKMLSRGIQCFSENVQNTLKNFTSSYEDAMNQAFASTAPNSTAPPPTGLSALPSTVTNSIKLLFHMLTSAGMRDSVVVGVQSFADSFRVGYDCAWQNKTDLTNPWRSLSTLLVGETSTSSSAEPKIAAQLVVQAMTSELPTTQVRTVTPAPTTPVPTTTLVPTTTTTTKVPTTTTTTTTPVPTTTTTTPVPTTTKAPTTTPVPTTTTAPTTTQRWKFLGLF